MSCILFLTQVSRHIWLLECEYDVTFKTKYRLNWFADHHFNWNSSNWERQMPCCCWHRQTLAYNLFKVHFRRVNPFFYSRMVNSKTKNVSPNFDFAINCQAIKFIQKAIKWIRCIHSEVHYVNFTTHSTLILRINYTASHLLITQFSRIIADFQCIHF